jgi:hypothetical protein
LTAIGIVNHFAKLFLYFIFQIIEPKPEVKRPANKKPQQFVFFFGSEN